MSVPLNVGNISGVYNFEYTSAATSDIFNKFFDQLVTLGNSTGPLTTADLNTYNTAMTNLAMMANGFGLNYQGILAPLDTPITAQQARGIGTLAEFNNSLNPGGPFSVFNAAAPALNNPLQLTLWRDLFTTGFGHNVEAIQYGSAGATNSLQSFLQLEYIDSGNKLIYDQLSQLSEAIKAVNGAMQTLKSLQLVMNRAAVIAYTTFTFIRFSGYLLVEPSALYVPGYYQASTTGLKKPLKISVDSTFATDLVSQGPALVTELQNAITALQPYVSSSGGSSPNLLEQMQQILTDIQQGQPGVVNQSIQQKFAWWVIDNHNVSFLPIAGVGTLDNFNTQDAGTYQNNLQNAITTAQSFSSQQNVNLKQTVFVFQEFYKSASAIMNIINTINKTMAQHESS